MKKIIEAIIVGIFVGLITRVAEQYFPANLKFLTETKIIWLLPAFLLAFSISSRRQTDAIIIAVITLIAINYTYYFAATIKSGNIPQISAEFLQITATSFLAGVATGLTAILGRNATNQFIRYGSASILPATFTGNGIKNILDNLNNFELTPEIGTKILGGFLLYSLIAGKNKFKRKSLLTFIALASISALIYLYMV